MFDTAREYFKEIAVLLGLVIMVAEVYQTWYSHQLGETELRIAFQFAESQQKNELLEILYTQHCDIECTPSHHKRLRGEALRQIQAIADRHNDIRNLSEAHLANVVETGLDLSKFDLSRADLTDAKLGHSPTVASPSECTQAIQSADLSDVRLIDVKASGLDLGGAALAGAQLIPLFSAEDVILRFATGDAATKLQGEFPHSDLSCAQLQQSTLEYSSFKRSSLIGVNLSSANLRGVDFEGADLTGANLQQANLTGANLKDAKLGGADFRGSTLSDANLSGTRATLGHSVSGDLVKSLDNATISNDTIFPEGFDSYQHGNLIRQP